MDLIIHMILSNPCKNNKGKGFMCFAVASQGFGVPSRHVVVLTTSLPYTSCDFMCVLRGESQNLDSCSVSRSLKLSRKLLLPRKVGSCFLLLSLLFKLCILVVVCRSNLFSSLHTYNKSIPTSSKAMFSDAKPLNSVFAGCFL